MNIHTIDILVILLYLVTMVIIGGYFQKKASTNKESYLLGGKSLPWYYLGLSNASGMFDRTWWNKLED